MKTKSLCLTGMFLICFSAFSQLRIEDCYRKAQANYPLIKQYDLIEKTKAYNLSNAGKGYLPQVTFSAKATYQSDVTKIPVQMPGFEPISKDQYGAIIDVNQILWDGEAIKSQKKNVRTAAEVDKKQVEVTMYAINERVNQLFFGILLADAQICRNRLLQDELKRNYDKVQAYLQNGIANQTDLNAIKVDQLKAKQHEIQFSYTKLAYIEMLSKLIGETLSEHTEFVKPEPIYSTPNGINRPELALYDAQIRNLEAQNELITSGLMPKLSVFITGGYGNPGLNMLESGFSPYYIGGIKLAWNIGSFYTQKDNRNKIQTQIRSVETQRETFLFNTAIEITQKDNHVNQLKAQLKYDDEIIALRNSVKQASEAKMANGTLSGTDLMRDIHAEQQAIEDKIMHETEWLFAIYTLKFATNN